MLCRYYFKLNFASYLLTHISLNFVVTLYVEQSDILKHSSFQMTKRKPSFTLSLPSFIPQVALVAISWHFSSTAGSLLSWA